MASSWGNSWGVSWGNTWGDLSTSQETTYSADKCRTSLILPSKRYPVEASEYRVSEISYESRINKIFVVSVYTPILKESRLGGINSEERYSEVIIDNRAVTIPPELRIFLINKREQISVVEYKMLMNVLPRQENTIQLVC